MKNKKGQLFEGFLIGATMFVAIASIFAVVEYQSGVEGSLNPPNEIQDFYYNLDKFDYFHKEAGKLAIHESFAYVAGSKADCKLISVEGGLIQYWNNTCGPNNEELKIKFLEEVKNKFNEITGKKDFSIVLGGDRVKFTPTNIDSAVFVEKDFMNYNLTCPFGSEFYLDYPSLDFEKLHKDLVVDRKVSTPGWNLVSKEFDKYTLYILTTEDYYFYDEDYKPAEVKFAVEKLS